MARLKVLELRRLALVLSAVLFCFIALSYFLSGLWAPSGRNKMGSVPTTDAVFRYEVVRGMFVQSEDGTVAEGFDYRKNNMGLIDRDYETDSPDDKDTAWKRFARYVQHLATSSPAHISYKVLYLGRHGEGFHNVAEAYYGTQAWDDYWSKLDGNGTLFWSDAHLTLTGKEQALEAHAFFGEQLAFAKMPAPERYIVSPLYRCLQTANLTFTNLKLPDDRPFTPVIKEKLREVMGEHTCDRRSTRSVIHDAVPAWEIEAGFSERDELWRADHRETHDEHDLRSTALLDDVFAHERGTFLSFTAHSGMIASLLRVCGHREFKLPTGGLMPIVVKATRVS